MVNADKTRNVSRGLCFQLRSLAWDPRIQGRELGRHQKKTEGCGSGRSLERKGTLLVAGSYLRRDIEVAHGEQRFTTLTAPHLGGTVYIDHHARTVTRPLASQLARIERHYLPDYQVTQFITLPKKTDHPLGRVQTHAAIIQGGRERIRLIVETLAGHRRDSALVASVWHALLPTPLCPADLRNRLIDLGDLPAGMSFFEIGADEPQASLTFTSIIDYVYDSQDFELPEEYEQAQVDYLATLADLLPVDLNWQVGDKPIDLVAPGNAVKPLGGMAQIDAGLALAPSFFDRFGFAFSRLASLFDPLEPERFRLEFDWWPALRARLNQVEAGAGDELYNTIAYSMSEEIRIQLEATDGVDDVTLLEGLLDEDELEELENIIADDSIGPSERWHQFADTYRRDELAKFALAESGWLAPLVVDPVTSDKGVLAGEINWPGGADDEEETTYLLNRWEYQRPMDRFSLLDVDLNGPRDPSFDENRPPWLINIHFTNMQPLVSLWPDLLLPVALGPRGFQLDVQHHHAAVPFDFYSIPHGGWSESLMGTVVLWGAYVLSNNWGAGQLTVHPSRFRFFLEPVEDEGRVRWGVTYDHATSFVDIALGWWGWNPLQDPVQALTNMAVSIFEAGAERIGKEIAKQVNSALANEETAFFHFPTSFWLGRTDAPDEATAFVQSPEHVDAILVENASLYQRCIYKLDDTEPSPFDPNLLEDGAYVFHWAVLAEAIRRRLAPHSSDSVDVTLPSPAIDMSDLLPDSVTSATHFDADLVNELLAHHLIDAETGEGWLAWLAGRADDLWMFNIENSAIPLAGPAELRLDHSISLTFDTTVDFGGGVDGVGKSEPVADVSVSAQVQHGASLYFQTSSGDLIERVRFMEEQLRLLMPSLPFYDVPPSTGNLRLASVRARTVGGLRIGFAPYKLMPAFPAAVQMSVERFTDPEVEALEPLAGTNPGGEYGTALGQIARAAIARMDKSEWLSHPITGGVKYPAMVPIVRWTIESAEDPEQYMIRTVEDRLYMDFRVDTPIVPRLGFSSARA